ncbi:MAG: pyridoxamine 5'-phosphate oxidase family protein, partial [Phycisphaeraceae bacterium]|nr:pyridoxamine 5'-phosphate oxidase family protein [Phycisphaeraceae bacterium]
MNADASPPWIERALAVLAESTTCCLATVGPQGRPHAANLNFVHRDKLELIFISSPQSAHIRHLDLQPAV